MSNEITVHITFHYDAEQDQYTEEHYFGSWEECVEYVLEEFGDEDVWGSRFPTDPPLIHIDTDEGWIRVEEMS